MNVDRVMTSLISKWKIKPKTVRQTMIPITIFGWILGTGIIEFPCGKPWPILSFLYTLFLMAVYGILSKISISNFDIFMEDASSLGKIVFTILFYSNIVLCACDIILGWKRIKRVKNIIDRFEESEIKMKKIGIPDDNRLIYVKLLSSLLINFVLIVLFMLLAVIWRNETGATIWQTVPIFIACYYPAVLTCIGDMSFISLVRCACARFNELNNLLLSMSTATENSPQHKRVLEYTRRKLVDGAVGWSKRTNDDEKIMRAARDYHHELKHISYMINDTFGIQCLLSMTVSFIFITTLLYNICDTLPSSLSREKIHLEAATSFFWLSFYVQRVIRIIISCANASAAAKEAGFIICHLYEPSTKKAYRDEIRDFTLQLTQQPLEFTACGFFTLSYAYIHGMIGSITTYLVILMQIGETLPPTILANITTQVP